MQPYDYLILGAGWGGLTAGPLDDCRQNGLRDAATLSSDRNDAVDDLGRRRR